MKKILTAIILIASTCAVAAADIPQAQPYTRAPVVVPSPAYNWTGFYIGAMGGYGWSDQVTIAGLTQSSNRRRHNAPLVGGKSLRLNQQRAPN